MAKIGTTSEISMDKSVVTHYRVISSASDIVGIFAERVVTKLCLRKTTGNFENKTTMES